MIWLIKKLKKFDIGKGGDGYSDVLDIENIWGR